MNLRRQRDGLHLYDRTTGVHLLLDEYSCPESLCDVGPEVLSVALLEQCNLDCDFCYAPKGDALLPLKQVLNWCIEADRLGTLTIALGGGEPLMHPEIVPLSVKSGAGPAWESQSPQMGTC